MLVKQLVASALVLGIAAAAGAQAPPATDIYLAPLQLLRGRAIVGTPVNITHRPGYDNQPSFTPDGASILYTSIREDGQADIYRYDRTAKTSVRVTTTPESEYSATVMPGGHRFSVIRVEQDSTQRLWSFDLDGADPQLVLPTLKPVGYHAWLSENALVTFVLGNPNAMVHADLKTSKLDTLARGIGRTLARLPDGSGFSFTQTDSVTHVRVLSDARSGVREVTTMPRAVQDMVWLPNGSIVYGMGAKLMIWEPEANAWRELADLSGAGLTQITRLAVSPGGTQLAIVAVPKS